MTKKDYILIASNIDQHLTRESILNEVIIHNSQANKAVARVAITLAHDLKKENPRFDANRFFEACGLTNSRDGILRSTLLDYASEGLNPDYLHEIYE